MPAVGETIGSYQILKQLGSGAMGEVYLAEHRHLKRKAAVKLLAPELVGRPDLLERFFLEARATSAIAHPGIVQVFDCEVDGTGRPYIVMEYLDGQTLAALLARRGALPGITAARLGRGMAEALQAAHEKGIIHRDLKPENIFVQAQPPDTVKLVDFGIAKLAGDFRAGQVHQTRSGAIMGTPLYMSPEQCRDSASIDDRTDLYSLGCVIFEMVTGRPPFTQTALGDLVVAHMLEAPPEVRSISPTVPRALAELVGELLRKNPAERPAGMRAVADRLATFLGGVTTVPEPLQRGAVAAKLATKAKTTFGDSAAELVDEAEIVPRSRSRLALALVALVALGAGGAAFSRLRSRSASDAVGVGGVGSTAAAASSPVPPVAPAPPSPPSAAAPAAAAPVAVAPIAPVASAPRPAAAPAPSTSRESAASAKKSGHHHAVEVASATGGERTAPQLASSPPAAPPPAEPSRPSPALAPFDFSGVWEGPWSDAEHQQSGRLYLQIGGGSVSGWFSNSSAGQSYQLVGQVEKPGDYALTCQCPENQEFSAHVVLHASDDGDVRGRVSLSSPTAGLFGQSHVVLRRSAAR